MFYEEWAIGGYEWKLRNVLIIQGEAMVVWKMAGMIEDTVAL